MKFADTSWWVAWALPNDRHHDAAMQMLANRGRAEKLLTTNLIIGECWTFLRRKDNHSTAVAYLDRINTLTATRRLVIHRVTANQENAAWVWLRGRDEREYSFVDATSFQVMQDRPITEAFAFDGDFSAAGFIEVRP